MKMTNFHLMALLWVFAVGLSALVFFLMFLRGPAVSL